MYVSKQYFILFMLVRVSALSEEEVKEMRRKYVLKLDSSEFCKAGVIPSVFLGRRVAATNAQMLHFSELDLPYSCEITVRTQVGYQIIMAVYIGEPSDNLDKACANEDLHMVVSEMADIESGYWAGVPSYLVEPSEPPNISYTMKTVDPIANSLFDKLSHKESEETEDSDQHEQEEEEGKDKSEEMMSIEIPLLNFSSTLVPGNIGLRKAFNKDELFDLFFDVTPVPGEKYSTKLVKLLQVPLDDSVFRNPGILRNDNDDDRYTRSSSPKTTRRPNTNRNVNLHFAKSHHTARGKYFEPFLERIEDNSRSAFNYSTWSTFPVIRPEDNNLTVTNDPSHIIDDLIGKIKKIYGLNNQSSVLPTGIRFNLTDVLDIINNGSLYLNPKLEVVNGSVEVNDDSDTIPTTKPHHKTTSQMATQPQIDLIFDVLKKSGMNRTILPTSRSNKYPEGKTSQVTKEHQRVIDELMSKVKKVFVNHTKDYENEENRDKLNLADILENVYKQGYGKSLYLHPNIEKLGSGITENTGTAPKTIPHTTLTNHATEAVTEVTELSKIEKDIDELMGKIKNIYGNNTTSSTTESFNLTDILKHVYKEKYNRSLYLNPDLTDFYNEHDNKPAQSTMKTMVYNHPLQTVAVKSAQENINKQEMQSTLSHSSGSKSIEDVISDRKTGPVSSDAESSVIKFASTKPMKYSNPDAITKITKKRDNIISAGTLVDHESWENVVQAAPVMANLLYHKPRARLPAHKPHPKRLRNKRYVQPVTIEKSRPRIYYTTKGSTASESLKDEIDVHASNFAHLVEIPDNDITGRADLGNLSQFKGPALLKICGKEHVKNKIRRHVLLFDSSRILISINNFTMQSLMVVVTTAMKITDVNKQCPKSYLECQVAGSRVCVDSISACDGIPNCGSKDMYDEDRMLCGGSLALNHNVYLAAFTFLAVLLTFLYIIHYWLKRCVPKVSDAFFIYTDGVENILYLDTIMRSPTDNGDEHKQMYQFHEDDDVDLYPYEQKKSTETYCQKIKRMSKSIFCFYRSNKKQATDNVEKIKRVYSFPQMELSKMLGKITSGKAVDASIQTGDSLEMGAIGSQHQLSNDTEEEKFLGELNLLKFLKTKNSDSDSKVNLPTGRPSLSEHEITKTVSYLHFQSSDSSVMESSTSGLSNQNLPGNRHLSAQHSRKILRFDEQTYEILPVFTEDEDELEEVKPKSKSGVQRGKTKQGLSEPVPSHVETKPFWVAKSKWGKKKNNP